MSSAPFFTVFTPTYNRAHTIERVYHSLQAQTFSDFEWLVVDDGSTDNTKALIEHWQQEASFPIRYFWQSNGHKKTAFNRGVREARGELFICVDSDDALTQDALEIFHKHWLDIPESERPNFVGVRGLCIRPDGNIVGDRYPDDIIDGNLLEMSYRYGVGGEKLSCDRTDVLRKFPFPEHIPGHVPEGVVWHSVASQYKTRFINEVVRIYFDSEDSLSCSRYITAIRNNAQGHLYWAAQVLSTETIWLRFRPGWFLRMAANYTRFFLHMRADGRRKRMPTMGKMGRSLIVMMWPVGVLLYLRDKMR